MKTAKFGALAGWLLLNMSGAEAQRLANAELSVFRAEVQRINAQLSKTRRALADIWGESAEGGSLTNFWRGDVLLKSSVIHYGEMGQGSREIWYRNGLPIFVFQQDRFYDRPLSGRVVRREENRFYLQNRRLLAWKFGSKWQNLSSKSRMALEKEIAADSKNAKRAP